VSGVRGRMAAALALVAVVTLGIVALALLAPLDRQLRDDEIGTLAQAGRDNATLIAELPPDALTASDPRLARALRTVRRSIGGDAALVDGAGRIVATTDPDASERFPDGARTANGGGSSSGIDGSEGEGEARVAVPVSIGGAAYGLALRKPLDDAREAATVVRREFEIAAAISLLVALLLGFTLSSGLARRLRDLRDTALRVAEIGPVAEVKADERRDEVGDLTRAFAEMQRRLREQEQSRKSFVATASHELRTPLASLLVMLDLLRGDLEEPADVPDARVQAERAEAQAERLSDLAAELLDLSRMDAGVALRTELIELGEAAAGIAGEFDDRARAAGLEVASEVEREVWAVADPGAVMQILRILTDNAVRHAPAGTEIGVEAQRDADGWPSLAVVDAGRGVAAGDRKRIFERFERGADASTSAGFGLGLAIGRELARQMGGDLVLDPYAEGGRFVLRLPPAPSG